MPKNEEIFGVTWLSGSLVLLSAADDVISVFLDALKAFKLFLPSHLSNQRFCKVSRELKVLVAAQLGDLLLAEIIALQLGFLDRPKSVVEANISAGLV